MQIKQLFYELREYIEIKRKSLKHCHSLFLIIHLVLIIFLRGTLFLIPRRNVLSGPKNSCSRILI